MKQESIPPFLGIVGDKKWSPFLDLGIPSPIFLHPKSLKMAVFGCKKNGTKTLKPLSISTKYNQPIYYEDAPVSCRLCLMMGGGGGSN